MQLPIHPLAPRLQGLKYEGRDAGAELSDYEDDLLEDSPPRAAVSKPKVKVSCPWHWLGAQLLRHGGFSLRIALLALATQA